MHGGKKIKGGSFEPAGTREDYSVQSTIRSLRNILVHIGG